MFIKLNTHIIPECDIHVIAVSGILDLAVVNTLSKIGISRYLTLHCQSFIDCRGMNLTPTQQILFDNQICSPYLSHVLLFRRMSWMIVRQTERAPNRLHSTLSG